jgi:L-alanine-DL-glutamate epimerase-like enolase superfamily enzyme
VEIEADGVVGIGETWINYPSWAEKERFATMIDGVGPLLLGMDASSPDIVQEKLTHALLPVGRQWGAVGPIWQAISGVDIALWDLRGKAASTSSSNLLEGQEARNNTVSAYASGVGPDNVTALCERALEAGYTAIKVKIGFGKERDRAILEEARSAIGDDVKILADANQAYELDDAIALCAALEKFDIGWLEEPIAGDGVQDLQTLHDRTGIPIATGENVYGVKAFDSYIDSGGIRFIQPDLTKSGGLTVAHKVAMKAASTTCDVAPHCYGSAVGVAASMQIAAANRGVTWMEMDVRENPLREDLLEDPFELRDGLLSIPQGPGLGITLRPDTLTRLTVHQEEIRK